VKKNYSIFASSLLLSLFVFTSACDNNKTPTTINTEKTTENLSTTTKVSNELPNPSSIKPQDGVSIDLTGGKLSIGGQILDSTTGKIIDKKINISVTGKDISKVDKTEFVAESGLITVTLKKGNKPSSTNPLDITVVAQTDGYFSSSSNIKLTQPDASLFTIKLVSMTTPPEGIATAEDTGLAGNDGKLLKTLSIQLKEGKTNTEANLNFTEGTVITDKDGKPLSGDLKANVGFFSNGNQNALSSFPGGFSPTVENKDGKDESGSFVTGGFISVDIEDSTGKKATNFNKPVELTMQVPKGTMNPETGNEVKNGDKIDIWSYESTSGQWKHEGAGTAKADTSGNFNVNYTVTHLSYWNLDWFSSETCNPTLKFNWKDKISYYPVKVKVNFLGANQWLHDGDLSDEINQLYNFPTEKKILFTASIFGVEVGKTEIALHKDPSAKKAQYWWEEDKLCLEDVVINADVTNIKLPKVVKLPADISFKIQNLFAKDGLKTFLEKFVFIDATTSNQILDILYSSDPSAKIKLTDDIYKKLADNGIPANKISMIKQTIDIKIYPYIPFWYRNATRNEDWAYAYLYFGADFTFFDGEEYEFKIIYQGKEYTKKIKISESLKSFVENIELPINVASAVQSGQLF